MQLLDRFSEDTDEPWSVRTLPQGRFVWCGGATSQCRIKSHGMETFIFKSWPQSWGGKRFFQAVPTTPCLCWNKRVIGEKQRGVRLPFFIQNHRAGEPQHPSNENDRKQWFIKNLRLRFLLNEAWFGVWILHGFGWVCEYLCKAGFLNWQQDSW